MKKICLVVQNKDVMSTIEALRELGAVHVEHVKKPGSSQITVLMEDAQLLQKVIAVLSQGPKRSAQDRLVNWREKAAEILGRINLIDQLKEDMVKRQAHINQWEPWGDFNPEDIKCLEKKGYAVQFVEMPEKDLDNVPEGVLLETIFIKNKRIHGVIISRQTEGLPFPTLPPPAKGLSELKRLQESDSSRIKETETKIHEAGQYLETYHQVLISVEDELAFHEVYAGRGVEEGLAFLKGFCPVNQCKEIEALAKKEHWGLLIEEPTDEDIVPTLTRNPKWIEMVKPVFHLMNIIPGYKEFDISLFFLLFFSIFTGMLIGDAGYGILFLLVAIFIHFKFRKQIEDKTPIFLTYILSSSIILWGILTGTFFGQGWLPDIIQPVLPWLRNSENIMSLCFIIGVAHLSIAHIWRSIIKFPSVSFLGEVGLLFLLWAIFFGVRFLILKADIPSIASFFALCGGILVLCFIKPNKNIFKAIGSGIGDLYGSIIGSFTDIISYIRLFAVGLSSVAVADAFNKMASDVGFDSILTSFFSVFILLAGHTLNVILCCLAVLVHGVRLNILEFSGHLGVEWSGIPFRPFNKREIVKPN